jgi:hypothetical protein
MVLAIPEVFLADLVSYVRWLGLLNGHTTNLLTRIYILRSLKFTSEISIFLHHHCTMNSNMKISYESIARPHVGMVAARNWYV